MAPGLRSGRTAQSRVAGGGAAEPGGRSLRRTDAAGRRRSPRTRWRSGAAGMQANRLLSVGLLLLIARRAAAAEEKSTFDASGSSSLQSYPTATATPHALADPSVVEEVPLSVVHSGGDSASERRSLSRQPAFSSVLTFMAGTANHPVSLDQTSPTITGDKTRITQWPSRSSSHGSEMSSSSSSTGDKNLLTSSGLTSNHQHTSPPQAVTKASTFSWSSHVSHMDGNKNASVFSLLTVSFSSMSSSLSPPAPSSSSLLSSVVGWINKAASSSQSPRFVSTFGPQTKTAELSPAGSLDWTDGPTTTQSSTHSLVDPTAVTQRLQRTKVIKTPASSTYTAYSTANHGGNLLKILYRPNEGMNSVSANNVEISNSFPRYEVAQRKQGALQEHPTSALQSGHPKTYALSSTVTQQMLNQTAHMDSQTSVLKGAGDAIMSPLGSDVIKPNVSPMMTFRHTGSFFTLSSRTPSLSETAVTDMTPIHSGTVSSEHASDIGGLAMAEGYGSHRMPSINIRHNQGETAEEELKSPHAYTHLNNSISFTQSRLESTPGFIFSPISRASATSPTSESDSLHLQVQTGSPKGITQEPTGRLMPKMSFPSNSRRMTLSGSALTLRFAKDMTYKPTYQSLSRSSWPAHLRPAFVSDSPNHSDTDQYTSMSANSEVNFADQAKASLFPQISPSQRPFQTKSLNMVPHKFYTIPALTPSPSKSHPTMSTTEISAHIRAAHSTALPFQVDPSEQGHAAPANNVLVTDRNRPAGSFLSNGANSSLCLSFDGNEKSTQIRDTAFNKNGFPATQFTTQFPPFMTTKDKDSEGSSKGSPTGIPFSPEPFDAALETLRRLRREEDVTVTGHYKQSSASSWSDIVPTLQRNTNSHSTGSITSVRSEKSNSYLGAQTAIPSSASSSDGQSNNGKYRAIFSFGPKIMAHYTKWKTTQPLSFQSTSFESENSDGGFDRMDSNFQADGPSNERLRLEDGQEHNVHLLSSTDPTVMTSDPYSLYPAVVEHSPLSYAKGTPGGKEQSLTLLAHPRSAVHVNVHQGATVNTAAPPVWGSHGFMPLSHVTSDSVRSSQASYLALVDSSKHGPPLADMRSLESALDTADTLSNNPALDSSDGDNINGTRDLNLRGLTSPTEFVPSSSSFHSSPSSSETPLSYSSVKASQLSSLRMKPFPSVSSKAPSSSSLPSDTIVSIKPTTYPRTSSSSVSVRDGSSIFPTFAVLTETETDELTTGKSGAGALTFPKDKVASLAPAQSVRMTLSAGPTERPSQVPPLPPRQDTTTASVKLTTTTVASYAKTKKPNATASSPRVTTATTQSTTTPQPTPVTWRATATTTVRTQTSRRTFTPPLPRTSPPRGATAIFLSPFTTTTEASPQQCNITERLWVKTVVSIYVRRNRLDSIQRQNLRRGLSQGLRKALNDSSAQAQVETVFGSPNMTVAYHVTGGDIVYPPFVVLERLDSYGRDKLIADLRQYLPMVTALPLTVASWRTSPATGFQLKTVLQFVGAGDDPRSCLFSQMMEQRLEKVFSEAQAKVFNINSRLSVQILSVSQAASSPAVSLVYTVRNGTVILNGTAASNLLGQLSAELVGYFLFYPPLIIAEPMEYHNLNTSIATRDFWVITVIQDVDNASLEGQYQSFASLMEQRLAELFVLAGQQGTRFRRATAVGSYTVQMVSIRRMSGLKNPAEMTYYVQHKGNPLSGTSAAKVLNTVDSQTMALTLGYFVQLQAEPVVKNPPNNLWIIAAVLAPIAVVTLIIIIITAVLCRKNTNDFKGDAIGNLNTRTKMAYRRDVGYFHQPVQGFDYAKQHLGQQGGNEEPLPDSQDTLVMSLKMRDTPLSLEKSLHQDGTANKKNLTTNKHKSNLPSEDSSVISNESERLKSGRGLTVRKVTAQQKLTKKETRKRDDPYDTSSGSLQLISIKPMAAQPNHSYPASSDRHLESVVNGEVNLALKQKSDIEHYRNKLRLKAKRKGYYDFPSTDSSSGQALAPRQRHSHERAAGEHGRPLEPDDERGSTYVKSHRRHSQVGQMAHRSRQSLSCPSPGGTEMDMLVMRERPRRGIRNSGYDTEPELVEETNVDRLMGPRGYMYGRGLKGHSETSTLSSQPSIDEVRQQMHLLLEEAFSLASGGQSTSGRHHHLHHPCADNYSRATPPLPYADVVSSSLGSMDCGQGGVQWVPSYGTDVYQCSLTKPAFHFTQLPEMAMSSPPLLPRTGPPPGTSLRRSTSDLGPQGRNSETSVNESQHGNDRYGPTTRAALPSIAAEKPVSNYSGNPITAVYAIPATRPGYPEYFVSTPPTSYHSPSWMSYPPEPEDVPPQWADSLPLPGYVEAFPHPRYPQESPTRLPLQYNQALEQPSAASSTVFQQSPSQVVKDMDSIPLSSLSTSALVQAIRQEVAKLAKKQNDLFEF